LWCLRAGFAAAAAFLVGMLLAWPALAQTQKDITPTGKIPETEQAVAEGKVIYEERCGFCHGLEGEGDGAVADYLFPRPRDFTQGAFKLHSTASGEAPTDEDLYRTISAGIPGTSMPSWSTLTPQERWKVLYYIKTFSDEFDTDEEPEMPPTGPPVASGPEAVAKGRVVYEGEVLGVSRS
jgi:mono/diheme cytochrome c family protein